MVTVAPSVVNINRKKFHPGNMRRPWRSLKWGQCSLRIWNFSLQCCLLHWIGLVIWGDYRLTMWNLASTFLCLSFKVVRWPASQLCYSCGRPGCSLNNAIKILACASWVLLQQPSAAGMIMMMKINKTDDDAMKGGHNGDDDEVVQFLQGEALRRE